MILFKKHVRLLKRLVIVFNERVKERRNGNEDIEKIVKEFIDLMFKQAKKDKKFRKTLIKWLTGETSTTALRDDILSDGLGLNMKHCNTNLLNRNAFYTLDTLNMYARERKL
jgi:hypothetical protein